LIIAKPMLSITVDIVSDKQCLTSLLLSVQRICHVIHFSLVMNKALGRLY